MRVFDYPLPLVLAFVLYLPGQSPAAENTHAGEAVRNAVKASSHATASVAHSIAASGRVTSAAGAVPLSVGGMIVGAPEPFRQLPATAPLSAGGAALGSAGGASTGAARGLINAATAPIGKPLEITDEAITATPPNEALKTKKDEKSDKNT